MADHQSAVSARPTLDPARRRRRWITFPLTVLCSLMLVIPTGMLTAAQARTPHLVAWRSHPKTVHADKAIGVTLARADTAACNLTVTTPKHRHRTFRYPAGAAPLTFTFAPKSSTLAGRYKLTATCRRPGAKKSVRATTHLRVVTGKHGRRSLVSKRGPAWSAAFSTAVPAARFDDRAGGRGSGAWGDDYPAIWRDAPQDSRLDNWGEYIRECTSFVAWALHSRNGYDMPWHANAENWGYIAQQRGVRVDNTPAVGAVAWVDSYPNTADDGAGHVAWVSAVNGGQVTIQEYNYDFAGHYHERTVPASKFKYIHFKDLQSLVTTQPPATNPTTNPTPASHSEQAWTNGARTFTDPAHLAGEGPRVPAGQWVSVTCKIYAYVPGATSLGPDYYFYRVQSAPWNDAYYAPANSFANGDVPGHPPYTHPTDWSVPNC